MIGPSGQTTEAPDLTFFIKLVETEIGLRLDGKEHLISSRLRPLAQQSGLDSLDELMQRIRRGDKALLAVAIDAMTTNETFFFREAHVFDTLTDDIIPELREANLGRLTAWSAASSSGQEAYSLAIAIRERSPEIPAAQTRILATDISQEMVGRCAQGEYSRFEINRGLAASLAMKHFDQKGRTWQVKRELRSMIDARRLNLVQPWSGLPRCDLVLLRNVLVYFDKPIKEQILHRIRSTVLRPNGYLVLGASETMVGLDSGFEQRRIGPTLVHTPAP